MHSLATLTMPAHDRNGRPIRRRPLLDRVMGHVDKNGPRPVWQLGRCWEWTGSADGKGYGHVRVGGVLLKAHRVVYELLVGPIGDRPLDHRCRNHRCVRPSHLEPVTVGENTSRGDAPTAVAHRERRCQHGHPVVGDNVGADGTCLICARRRYRKWYDTNRRASAA